MTDEMSLFARTIYLQKYAKRDDTGTVVEDWPDTANRVVTSVLDALYCKS